MAEVVDGLASAASQKHVTMLLAGAEAVYEDEPATPAGERLAAPAARQR
ncbi:MULTISPECIES: hypothetical protein [unclassified Pseudonocardia]|nr:hypothetical protein [Pseudonocardia sp. ICBG601]